MLPLFAGDGSFVSLLGYHSDPDLCLTSGHPAALPPPSRSAACEPGVGLRTPLLWADSQSIPPNPYQSAVNPDTLFDIDLAGPLAGSIQDVNMNESSDLSYAALLHIGRSGDEAIVVGHENVMSEPATLDVLALHDDEPTNHSDVELEPSMSDKQNAAIVDSADDTSPTIVEPLLKQEYEHDQYLLPADQFCQNNQSDTALASDWGVTLKQSSAANEDVAMGDEPSPGQPEPKQILGKRKRQDVAVVIPVKRALRAQSEHASTTEDLFAIESIKIDPTKLCFLDLPGEVRNQVYSYVLPPEKAHIVIHSQESTRATRIIAVWSRTGSRNINRGTPIFGVGLLATCKSIHNETFNYLYGSNPIDFEDTGDARTFLASLRDTTLLALRDINVGWIDPKETAAAARLLAKCANLYRFKFDLSQMNRYPYVNCRAPKVVIDDLKPVFKTMYATNKSKLFRRIRWTLGPVNGPISAQQEASYRDTTTMMRTMILEQVDFENTPAGRKAARDKDRDKRRAKRDAKKKRERAKKQKEKAMAKSIRQKETGKTASSKGQAQDGAAAVNVAPTVSVNKRNATKTGENRVQKETGGSTARQTCTNKTQTNRAVRINPSRAAKSGVKNSGTR